MFLLWTTPGQAIVSCMEIAVFVAADVAAPYVIIRVYIHVHVTRVMSHMDLHL